MIDGGALMRDIPFIAYEAEMTRMERVNRRLWIESIVLLMLLICSNALWVLKAVM